MKAKRWTPPTPIESAAGYAEALLSEMMARDLDEQRAGYASAIMLLGLAGSRASAIAVLDEVMAAHKRATA
jgi:hypothetical protein